jgi:hypothetical protein
LAIAMRRPRSGDDDGRFDSVCGEIGDSTMTRTDGSTIGPPAESEYAVDRSGWRRSCRRRGTS